MKKQKVAFMAPRVKGGTYYYYYDIVNYLNKNYSDQLEVNFCTSYIDYFILHFKRFDIIFSIIPFLFKPIGAKRYIYNLHGNYKKERLNKGLSLKLLYFSELNIWFSDRVMLTSYYLANKLNFIKKYNNKIFITPLFVKNINYNQVINPLDTVNILTVSSAAFLKKGMGVYNLCTELFKIKNIKINFTIVLPGKKQNKKIILDKIKNLNKPNNIYFKVLDLLSKTELNNYYKGTDIFVYSSGLDTWGGTIMESCSFGKPVILLDNDLWKYIYPKSFVTDDLGNRLGHILLNYGEKSDESINFVKNYEINYVIDNLVKNEILNYNANL